MHRRSPSILVAIVAANLAGAAVAAPEVPVDGDDLSLSEATIAWPNGNDVFGAATGAIEAGGGFPLVR